MPTNNCNTIVNNMFAYGPNGKVFFAAINFLGRWADNSLTACFLHHMKAKIGDFKICINQGFPWSGKAYRMLLGWVMNRASRHLHCDVFNCLLLISNIHMLLQHASEWGMRGLQGTFPHCKKHFPRDLKQQRQVLKAIVIMHNFQTDYIGYNQILTVFDPKYVCMQNLQGYGRITQKQYYFHPGDYDIEVDGSG
jgi:hypothetical protein